MKLRFFSRVVAIAGALIGGVAHASLIDHHEFTLTPDTTEVLNYQLVLPKFDSSLGTLTGVTLYFRATEIVSNFSIINNSATTQTFNAGIFSTVNSNPDNTANSADAFGEQAVLLFGTNALNHCGASVKP